MYRMVYLAVIFTLICACGAGYCQIEKVRPAAALKAADPDDSFLAPPNTTVLQKLRAPMSKQALVNTLMSDPKTKSALTREGGKLGFNAAQIQNAASVRLPALGNFETPVDQVEVAYRALDWHSGFNFTIDNIPTYGPTNRKLATLALQPCKLYSTSTVYTCMNPQNTTQPYAGILNVELPTEPAIYALTVKISRWYAPCYPNWLNPKPGTSIAPIVVRFKEARAGSSAITVPVTLTPLPDGYGYVGIISANPSSTLSVPYSMRKATAQIVLSLYPSGTRPGEEMGDLMFRGFTITRL